MRKVIDDLKSAGNKRFSDAFGTKSPLNARVFAGKRLSKRNDPLRYPGGKLICDLCSDCDLPYLLAPAWAAHHDPDSLGGVGKEISVATCRCYTGKHGLRRRAASLSKIRNRKAADQEPGASLVRRRSTYQGKKTPFAPWPLLNQCKRRRLAGTLSVADSEDPPLLGQFGLANPSACIWNTGGLIWRGAKKSRRSSNQFTNPSR